ncbi:sensor histidine kinase [Amycolatopsis suaedae]|uniref:histidine kinase n=1 Tax=Amycolatopsis suaedae TaxID=2510978 RepID=A0A4Q7JAV9_9PSEU|nr:histidine kinase [Amycolatopsis suaedae]RZQ64198.1 sensor histidine kinase [Amycolatopsis suaedae]
MGQVRAAARATAGLALGGLTAVAELAFVLVGSPLLAVPATGPFVSRVVDRLVYLERRRLSRWLRVTDLEPCGGWRGVRYLTARSIVGGLGLGVLLLIGYGAVVGVIALWMAASTGQFSDSGDPDGLDWYDPIGFLLLGVLLLFVAVQGLIGVAALERRLAAHFLTPSATDLLYRRMAHLSTSRDEVVAAVDDERRRIERDLHDGVQQRLVALGMLVGRARRSRDPERTADLLRQAQEETQRTLDDLREVSWRVFPHVLDAGGLRPALDAVAERSSLPLTLRYAVSAELSRPIETAAYFVVSEAVTNAVKHGGGTRIGVDVVEEDGMVHVVVSDDGCGGARASGGGLSGLARRVAAADGTFTLDSPAGGPTVVRAVLPCA